MTREVVTDPPLPSPAPVVNRETKPFWDATAEGRLLLQRCDGCQHVIWYPRTMCPLCHGTETSWFEGSGRGSVYTYTIVHRGQGPWRDVAPFVAAYVTLEEGPTVLTNVVGCDPAGVSVGMAVEVEFHATGEGPALPRFRPAG